MCVTIVKEATDTTNAFYLSTELSFEIRNGWGLLVVCLQCETNYVSVGQNPSPQCQQLSF